MANAKAVKNVKSVKSVKSVSKKAELPVVGTSGQGFGTAKEQNRAYAKLARRYAKGVPVRELNGQKRNGYIASAAKEGSGFVEVRFDDSTEVLTKHVCDLQIVKLVKLKFAVGDTIHHPEMHNNLTAIVKVLFADGEKMNVEYSNGNLANGISTEGWTKVKPAKAVKVKSKKPDMEYDGWLFKIGSEVEHPAHGVGKVVAPTSTNGVYDVAFEKDRYENGVEKTEFDVTEVQQDELKLLSSPAEAVAAKQRAAKKEAKAKRPQRLKFEQISLFSAFSLKDRTFVKVSKSNAIPALVQGSVDEPFAMLATQSSKMANSAIQRFKKDDKVVPYAGPVQQATDAVTVAQ